MENNKRKSIVNERADFAYKKVIEVINDNLLEDKNKKEYKSYVKRIPMLIKTNGLGATFAFIYSKLNKNIAYKRIYQQVEDWIKNNDNIIIELKDNDDLMGKIVQLSSSHYRALTIEILALFNWLRRFAEGMIEGEINDE